MTQKDELAFPMMVDGIPYVGLEKREYFAAIALQGLMANSSFYESAGMNPEQFARRAVQCADALINQLNED